MRVYIAGPISKGNMADNARIATHAADRVLDAGHAPFLPHLSVFWQAITPHEYEQWLRMDFEWIDACGALIRIPGESPGADREVEYARKIGIAVYFSVDEFLAAVHT